MLLPSALGFSPHPPVSVYGTGLSKTIAAFLDAWLTHFPTLNSVRITSSDCTADLPTVLLPRLHRLFLFRLVLSLCVPTFSVILQYRNLNLLSIDYVFRPRLRPRLTQGRSALPWKPWIFGRKDSHLPLATHSGILSSYPSTAPYRYSFVGLKNAPLPIILGMIPQLRCCVSAPDIFGAGPLD